MDFSLNQTIRSLVILVVGLPLTVALSASVMDKEDRTVVSESEAVKTSFVSGCVDYMLSKEDSKLERQGQDKIDAAVGAAGADYRAVCSWVLK